MNFRFNSQHIACTKFLPSGVWELTPTQQPFPWLRSAPISLLYHDQRRRYSWLAEGDPYAFSESRSFQKTIGSSQFITMEWDTQPGQLTKKVEYALSDDGPILLWRFHTTNRTGKAIHLDWIIMLHTGIIGPRQHRTLDPYRNFMQRGEDGVLGLGFEVENPEFAFYTSGWQSWNYAGTLDIHDPTPWSLFGPIDHPVRINAGTPRPKRKGHFISDFFAVFGDRRSRMGLILGSLSQRQAFSTIEGWVHPAHPTLRMWANLDGIRIEEGESFSTDWAYLELIDLNRQDPLCRYFEAVAVENNASLRHDPPVGWCSWYHAYESVSEKWMMDNISWASANRDWIPLNVIQLDDGYEKEVGDWTSWKDSFPNGIEPVCNAIRGADFTPGVWFAPFIAKRRSEIAQAKPEWILRNRFGFPVNPGFLWDSFPYVLDVTHPEVIQHLRNLITNFVERLGFEYLKLDFLYAGALPGIRYDPSRTRAQSLYKALQAMKDAAREETELLGCGCPLGSGIGIFDIMRIGPDVAPRWKPYYKGIETLLDKEQAFPSTRNAIVTTVNRLPMHQRWWVNDPDCLIVRSVDNDLTEAEVKTLASVIAMSGGALLLSDHLPSLVEERMNWFARLIPSLPQAAIALDWFDTSHPSKFMMDLEGEIGSWKLIMLINWADQPTDLLLDLREYNLEIPPDYHLLDFWKEDYRRLSMAEIRFKEIPPHGACLLSLREVCSQPQWLGDTFHVSQGLIVKNWQIKSDHLYVQLDLGRKMSGKAWIALQTQPTSFKIEDQEIAWKKIVADVYQIEINIDGNALLKISW
jgi:alpha-galactosidase